MSQSENSHHSDIRPVGSETRNKDDTSVKSSKCSVSPSILVRKRADAEKAKIELEFARKQADIELRKKEIMARRKEIEAQEDMRLAEMEADNTILEHEKKAAMLQTEVFILETSEGSMPPILLPKDDPADRTQKYVNSLQGNHHPAPNQEGQHSHNTQLEIQPSSQLPSGPTQHCQMENPYSHRSTQPITELPRSQQQQHMSAKETVISGNSKTNLNCGAASFEPDHAAFTTYLLRSDLLLSRLTNFNDKPEDYALWRTSFKSVTKELGCTKTDEFDLLMKWLGPESKTQAMNIRKANLHDPEKSINDIWKRLDVRYGSPEQVEEIIKAKVKNFPVLSSKDPKQLYAFADLMSEIESMMESETYGPAFSYFNTSGGVKQIVQKLPYYMQEKWSSLAFKHKEKNGAFPPFSIFSTFITDLSRLRNDPSFQYNPPISQFPHQKQIPNSHVRARLTEVHSESIGRSIMHNRTGGTRTTYICPMHGSRHSLNECHGFQTMTYDERIDFLRSIGFCFRCCVDRHLATDCRETVKCTKCNSTRHPSALHINGYNGQSYSRNKGADRTNHGGEIQNRNIGRESEGRTGVKFTVNRTKEPGNQAKDKDAESKSAAKEQAGVSSKCTQVCKGAFQGKSCAKNILVLVYPKGQRERAIHTYACLDDQSNASLCAPSLFESFDISGETFPYILSSCGGTQEAYGRRAIGFVVEALDSSQCFDLPTLIECQIPDNKEEIPTPEVARNHTHLHDIAEKIPSLEMDAPSQLLIGRDLPEVHHVQGQLTGPRGSPYAQRLPLGWVIIGEACLGKIHPPSSVTVNKLHTLPNGRPSLCKPCPSNLNIKETQVQETSDGIQDNDTIFRITKQDNETGFSTEDREFLQLMSTEMKQNDEGSWEAPLPFKNTRPTLPNNKPQAIQRAKMLEKSLTKNEEKRSHFLEFMKKLLDYKHAEIAPPLKNNEECWYLPIFGVYHPKKPSKIRAVFDSSAIYQGISLNSVLMQGPDLTNELIGILLKFRKDSVAIMADVEHMFHCFLVSEDHRNYLRFLWYRNNDLNESLTDYRMRAHCFGNKPSPAVASYGLRKAAEKGEGEFGTDTTHFVKENFYVDDAVSSFPTVDIAINMLKSTQSCWKKYGNIRLHKIVSNNTEVMQAFPTNDLASNLKDLHLNSDNLPLQRTLGMTWDIKQDTFKFNLEKDTKPCTRRGVLSTVNSVYDPLGLLAPVIIEGKLLLRDIASLGVSWDDPLPKDICDKWTTWRDSLAALQNVCIPRMYVPGIPTSFQEASKELHMYMDASEKVISAAAYLKVNGRYGFIMGKAKVAPTNGHTIPRLELCAATLAIDIALLVSKHLDLPVEDICYHSDSKIVLGYISNNTRRFPVYVTNRVEHIRKYCLPEQWKYVPTTCNPADQATRPVTANNMSGNVWLKGPNNQDQQVDILPEDCEGEMKDQTQKSDTKINDQSAGLKTNRFKRFSKWESLVQGISTLKQYLRRKIDRDQMGEETTHMLAISEKIIIKEVQKEVYNKEILCIKSGTDLPKNSSIGSLDPFISEEGLIRVGGRLRNADLSKQEKHPIIIPGRHHIALLLVRHHHEISQHQGRHFTEGAVRSAGLWITGCRRLFNSIIYKCIICRKSRGTTEIQKMADLPVDRLTPSPPFSYVGVDTFGPWDVVSRRTRGGLSHSKRWALLFTCLVTRAIHIEVIEEMSSSSFVNALRRFIAIRGNVEQFRSDRGTNFRGATDILDVDCVNIEDQEIKQLLDRKRVKWVFNPPHAPHMGGAWERMIGTVKRILNNMMKDVSHRKFTHEVLVTFLSEVCGIVNARPITAVTVDPDEPTILTPSTLLTLKTNPSTPPLKNCAGDIKDLYLKQWRQVQALADTFWSRFRRDYLHSLQSRTKWTRDRPNIQHGDVVLVKDSGVHRNEWPMGRVLSAIQSSDGKVRKAAIRLIRNGNVTTYTRPVTELVFLMSATE